MLKLSAGLLVIASMLALSGLGLISLVLFTRLIDLVPAMLELLSNYFSCHPFWSALFIFSIGLGVPVTWLWSWILHSLNQKNYEKLPEDAGKRHHAFSITFGIVERALLTTLVLWLPMAVGPIAAAWLGVKAVVGWAGMNEAEDHKAGHPARARFSVTLLGSAFSFLWAIGWGIWARWMAGMPNL
jgi:hypothetical protein